MKTFKYKFSTLQKILMFIGLLLCVAGFILNLVYLLKSDISTAAKPVYMILQYGLMFFVTVGLFIILITILLFSAYIIDGKYFKTRFGLITSRFDVEKIESVVLDRKTNKLTVYFESGEYIVIVVKQDWYNDFISALLEVNPKIEYSINSLENDGTDKKA